MPGFDGTGPLGQGPITGRGQGFCVLTVSEGNLGQVEGFAGLQSMPVGHKVKNLGNTGKGVTNMLFGYGTGPVGLGPITGRGAGFGLGLPVPGYVNPVTSRVGFYGTGVRAGRPYGAGSYSYGYAAPYAGWGRPWLRRGFGFGRGLGHAFRRGRGRGRFGYWW